jgi:immunity protein, SdpI family
MPSLRSPHTLVIAAGYALGAALYTRLPEQIPPSWDVPGRGVVWFGGVMVAFLLPTAAAVTNTLLRGLCVRHPIDGSGSATGLATYDAIMLRFILFLMGVHAMMLAGALGMLQGRGWAVQIVPVMLGLTMIGVGNLLPRTRPNLVIGIRTPHTLADRALWIRTHRVAGYTLVALGFVIVLAAIAVPPPIGSGMILLVGPAGTLGMAGFMWYCRRKARA